MIGLANIAVFKLPATIYDYVRFTMLTDATKDGELIGIRFGQTDLRRMNSLRYCLYLP